jgi:hypothetical protein
MKKMKKIILILITGLSFISCNNNSPKQNLSNGDCNTPPTQKTFTDCGTVAQLCANTSNHACMITSHTITAAYFQQALTAFFGNNVPSGHIKTKQEMAAIIDTQCDANHLSFQTSNDGTSDNNLIISVLAGPGITSKYSIIFFRALVESLGASNGRFEFYKGKIQVNNQQKLTILFKLHKLDINGNITETKYYDMGDLIP